MVLNLPEEVGRGENENEDNTEESFAAKEEGTADTGEEKS